MAIVTRTVASMRRTARDFGTCLQFTGGGGRVDIGAMGTYGSNLGNGMSLSCWFKTTSTAVIAPLGFLNTGITTGLFVTFNNDGVGAASVGKVRVFLRDESGKLLAGANTTALTLNDGNWHHFACTAMPSTNTITMYFDSYSVAITYATQTTPVTFANLAFNMFVGSVDSRGTPSNNFIGTLDEVQIWNRAISASEVQDIYTAGTTASTTNFTSYYKFDEGSGSSATDSIGSNTGTITGGTYVTDPVNKLRASVAVPRTTAAAATFIALILPGNSSAEGISPINTTPMKIGASSDFSFGTYINLQSKTITGNSDDHCLGDYDLNFGSNLGYAFYVQASSGKLQAVIGNTFYTSTYTGFTYGAWHWVIFTLTGTTLKAYVDGTLQWTQTVVRKATGGTNNLQFFGESTNSGTAPRHSYGMVRDVFSTLALMDQTAVTNVVSNGVFPATDLHYQNNEGISGIARDISGNLNHGLIASTTYGAQWYKTGRNSI